MSVPLCVRWGFVYQEVTVIMLPSRSQVFQPECQKDERRGEARFQWAHEEHEEGNSLHQQDHVFLMASVSLLMLKDLFCSLFVQSLRALVNSKITKTIRVGVSSCLMPLSLF